MVLSPMSIDAQLTDQNILNYCTSGDLKSLQRCSSALSRVVHNTFPDGQTCLIAACRNGNRDVVEYLIDACGADVEQVGVVEFESEQVEGVPPLWCASASGHLPVVEALVARGADVNRTTITNSTALRAACFDGHEQVVRFLVQHGANVEIPNRHGHTCLMISCYRRHDQIVDFLLSKNARVNRRSAKGNTALHDCAESGNLKGLQMLLEHGAIIRPDEYGQSPIMSGANAAFKKIVDYLASLKDEKGATSISIHEKIAAYELLGASLFDRHSLVQDAIGAWFHSLGLRQQAGTYPKTLIPPQLTCTCAQPRPMNTVNESPPRSCSPQRGSTSVTIGTNWSLVHLATREAVTLSERTNDARHDICYDRQFVGSRFTSFDFTHPPFSFLFAKRKVLQSELYRSYLSEIQPYNLIASLTEPKISNKCKNFTKCRRDTDFVSVGISFHPAVGLVHPATPADPLRRIGVMHWERPQFRRWPLDPSFRLLPFQGNTQVDSFTVECCNSCQKRIIRFGSRMPFSQLCTKCVLLPVATDYHKLSFDPTPRSVASSALNSRPSNAACIYHRLVSEDHPLVSRLRQFGEEAFGQVHEFTNEEELTELMRNAHALRLQPLLIRLRILGPDHLDTIYFIRYRGAIYADTDNFRRCLNLWRYALELQRIFLEPLCHVSQAAFASFAELFQFVLTNNYGGLSAVDLDPALIVDCLELAVDSVERGMDYSFYHWFRRYPWSYSTADKEAINLMRHVALCLHFIAMILAHYLPDPHTVFPIRCLLEQPIEQRSTNGLPADHSYGQLIPPAPTSPSAQSRMLNSMSASLTDRFLYQTYRLVRLDPRVHDGHNLVHLACSIETSTVGRFLICRFPDLAVLRLLFQLGADPNCADVHGQRPLLNVLSQRRLQVAEQVLLVNTLVENGAHLDATNGNGLSPLDPRFRHILSQTGIRLLDHITLECLAARVARHAGFTRRNSNVFLPDHIWSFLEMH